tara:strand:- start:3162 stop:4313 length:1152 start_codon:yes stop_codon:yes gene_type:complete
MDQAFLIVAAFTLVYTLYTLVEFLIGFNSIKNLSQQATRESAALPSVSIIFSALNEEEEIEAAVLSLLNIDYPDFEIIAMNDRSTDRTPKILNALQQRYPQLQVHHITSLPNGWFGKNHALHNASSYAKGEWLLFTDADVLMKPDTLTKAMSYSLEHDLQHLTICEKHVNNTLWLKVLLLAHYITYSLALTPWRIRHRWSKKSLGHGAFNLVKKSAYQACGSHQTIALECLDDLKLGQMLKKHGFKQDTVDGRDYIEREWYHALPDMIKGWEKNSFAYFDYQLLVLSVSSLFAVLFFIGPIVSLIFFSGTIRLLSLANVTLMLLLSAYVCQQFRLNKFYAFSYPAAILVLLYTIWNSVISVYKNNGVVWRGTHYPLASLRKAK